MQKTRFSINDENNIGRVREKCPTEILQIGGLNFFRLNNSSSQNVPINSAGDQLALGLGTRPTRSTTNDEVHIFVKVLSLIHTIFMIFGTLINFNFWAIWDFLILIF